LLLERQRAPRSTTNRQQQQRQRQQQQQQHVPPSSSTTTQNIVNNNKCTPSSSNSPVGMWVRPLPVEHGPGYTSLGFAFGEGSSDGSGGGAGGGGEGDGAFIYISDVSTIYASTLAFLQRTKIAVLVLDGLLWADRRPSHQTVQEALELVRLLR
jgi:phosphoribosyl 1,2-cyclic phosphodiesterase